MEASHKANSSVSKKSECEEDSSNEAHVIVQSFSVRAQKKLASTFGGRKMAKHFVDEETAELMKNVHKMIMLYSRSKETAKKITKYIIKLSLKIVILQQNKVFNEGEEMKVTEMKEKIHHMTESFISLLQRKKNFKFDEKKLENFLKLLTSSEEAFIEVTSKHLSLKSLNKFRTVTEFLKDREFLKFLASNSSEIEEPVESILKYIQDKIDRGLL